MSCIGAVIFISWPVGARLEVTNDVECFAMQSAEAVVKREIWKLQQSINKVSIVVLRQPSLDRQRSYSCPYLFIKNLGNHSRSLANETFVMNTNLDFLPT